MVKQMRIVTGAGVLQCGCLNACQCVLAQFPKPCLYCFRQRRAHNAQLFIV